MIQSTVLSTVVSLVRPEQLRQYVRTVLCEHDRLEVESTPFLEAPMKRGGRVCGLYFEVQGPRLMRSHAIWVGDEHRILFYDSTGARFADVRLSDAPDVQEWFEHAPEREYGRAAAEAR